MLAAEVKNLYAVHKYPHIIITGKVEGDVFGVALAVGKVTCVRHIEGQVKFNAVTAFVVMVVVAAKREQSGCVYSFTVFACCKAVIVACCLNSKISAVIHSVTVGCRVVGICCDSVDRTLIEREFESLLNQSGCVVRTVRSIWQICVVKHRMRNSSGLT